MELQHQQHLDLQKNAVLRPAPVVSLVLPCFNEEEVLPETTARLTDLLARLAKEGAIAPHSAVYYVDDGSSDRTWEIIADYALRTQTVCGIKLSRNRGHQNALLCGLMTAPGEVLISLDADLQDDLEAIPKMIMDYREGSEIVFAVRSKRDKDSFLKKYTAESYYTFLKLLGVDVIYNHADFRLMSRRTIEVFRSYGETHLFLRGLIRQLGFKTSIVEFERAERFAGESKYPLSKMLSLAWQGVTSFSAYPLRLITGVGVLVSIASLGMAIWALLLKLFSDQALPGWASTVIPMYFLGGVQLLGLGIVGEYLAKFMKLPKAGRAFMWKPYVVWNSRI